jgi:hypothetical protein
MRAKTKEDIRIKTEVTQLRPNFELIKVSIKDELTGAIEYHYSKRKNKSDNTEAIPEELYLVLLAAADVVGSLNELKGLRDGR